MIIDGFLAGIIKVYCSAPLALPRSEHLKMIKVEVAAKMALKSNSGSETVLLDLSRSCLQEDPFLALPHLLHWLRGQRWFMDEETKIASVEKADAFVLARMPDSVVYGLFVTCRFAATVGAPEYQKCHFIPVILSSSAISDVSAEDMVCLELMDGTLYLALAEHSKLYQEPWFRSLAAEQELVTQRGGRIRFQVLGHMAGLTARSLHVSTSHVLTLVESSPASWVNKTYKDLRGPSGEPGRRWQPNYEAMRYEALALAGYPNIPQLYGLVFYEAPDGTVAALSAVMEAVDKEEEIGGIFCRALHQYVKAWAVGEASQDGAFHRKHRQGAAAAAARAIAKTIARMHAGFLSGTGASFRSVAASAEDLQRWSEAPRCDVESALPVLQARYEARPDNALAVLI